MAKSGPKRTPTAKLRLRGSQKVERRTEEPTPPVTLPDPPAWLDALAVERWQEIGTSLEAQGLMTGLDAIALAMVVDAEQQYLAARKIALAAGPVSVTDKGNLVTHPAMGAMNRAWDRLMKALREFGMTPSARTNVAVGKVSTGKADGKSRFFNAG